MKTALRTCLAVALAVLLSTPATFARGPAVSRPTVLPGAELGVWIWLARLWAKLGGCIDPNGLSCAAPAAPPKHGCGIDPNGLSCAATAPPPKHGPCIDPNGLSCAAPAPPPSDAGPCIDPNGLFCAASPD